MAVDALGLAWLFREARAWSKVGKTGILRVSFKNGQIRGARRGDALGRGDMLASLRADGLPCSRCGEVLVSVPGGQVACESCGQRWSPEEAAEALEGDAPDPVRGQAPSGRLKKSLAPP